ncbi:MAG TPA: hypothetical protein DCX10_09025 [Verrucomicrobiales bacterium]|nr:hypothetical protein [Verrucomicrobiales bacterium]
MLYQAWVDRNEDVLLPSSEEVHDRPVLFHNSSRNQNPFQFLHHMSYMSISCLYNNYYLLWAKLSFSNAFVVIFLEWDDKLLQFKFDKSIEINEVKK